MAVHLTRIYTRTGDDGTTALGDMSRVAKTDPRVGAYADVDETNAALGVALAVGELAPPLVDVVRQVQNDLFDLGADLCTPLAAGSRSDGSPSAGSGSAAAPSDRPAGNPPLRITDEYISRLEAWCDEFNETLSPLRSFVLPGGTPAAALLHAARTVARRAERSTWALLEADPRRTNPLAATYLNRLSDLLFILARVTNLQGDVLWQPGGGR
jgi:cob(I)alamin adenosyltransferase